MNYGVSLMIITHLFRWFNIPFDKIFWRTYDFDFHYDWNATSNHDCHSSRIIFLILHLYTYIDSLRIEYHLLSVVILVKMFANVFSYNQITTPDRGKNFQKLQLIQQQRLRNLIHL